MKLLFYISPHLYFTYTNSKLSKLSNSSSPEQRKRNIGISISYKNELYMSRVEYTVCKYMYSPYNLFYCWLYLDRNRDRKWYPLRQSVDLRPLLGILDTSFRGRRTRNDLNIRRSTSTLASAKMVIDLIRLQTTHTYVVFGSVRNSKPNSTTSVISRFGL